MENIVSSVTPNKIIFNALSKLIYPSLMRYIAADTTKQFYKYI